MEKVEFVILKLGNKIEVREMNVQNIFEAHLKVQEIFQKEDGVLSVEIVNVVETILNDGFHK